MYSDGQQVLLGSRDAPWLGRGTAGSVGPGETALVSLISLKKITLLSHCWVPESCAGLQGGSFVIIMTVYQSNSWKLIWLRNRLYGEKLPRKVGKKKRGMWSWLSQHPSKGVARPQPFAGRTEWGCAQKKDPAPGVFSLLTGQGVRVALTVRGQVRCQQFLRVFWLQASQHQAHEEVGRL